MARLLQGLFLFGMYFCAASTTAQAIGLGTLYWRGALTPDKVRQYAAVLYHLDLPPPAAELASTPAEPAAPLPRSRQLAQRAGRDPLLEQQQRAIVQEKTAIEGRRRELQTHTQRYAQLKKSLDDSVTQLQAEADGAALAEIQQTLEIVQPVQAKAIVLRMLDEKRVDETQALAHVAEIMQALGADKLKKLLGEFKSETERAALHRILTHIGKLEAAAETTPVEAPQP